MNNESLSEMTRAQLKKIISDERLPIIVRKSNGDDYLIRRIIEERAKNAPVVKMEKREVETPIIESGDNHMHDEDIPKAKKPIVPIFIGCQDSSIVKVVTDFMLAENFENNDSNDYDIVIMGEEMLNGAVQTYFFNRLDKDNQDILNKQRSDELLRKTTLLKAMDVEGFLRHYLNNKTGEITFTPNTLEVAMETGLKKKISGKEVRDVIDLFTALDFAQPTELNVPYNKQRYKFTFGEADRLINTNHLIYQANEQIQQLQNQIEMLNINKQILESNIAELNAKNETIDNGENNNRLVQSGVEQLSDAGAPEVSTE